MTTITIERAVVHRTLRALEYHTQQTRPIHNTELVIEELHAALAAPATAPPWQDAPTVPGLWVRNSCDCIGAYLIHESAIPILQGSRSRWWGPLPEDKQ